MTRRSTFNAVPLGDFVVGVDENATDFLMRARGLTPLNDLMKSVASAGGNSTGVETIQNEGNVVGILEAHQNDKTNGIAQDLINLRHRHPFIQIDQFPSSTRSVVSDGTHAQDIDVPDLAKMVKFKTTGGADFFVDLNGNAVNPSGFAGVIGVNNNSDGKSFKDSDYNASVLNPDGWFYCGNNKQFSVLGTVAGQVINAQFYIEL